MLNSYNFLHQKAGSQVDMFHESLTIKKKASKDNTQIILK